MLALTAAMRKVIIIFNALVRAGQPWRAPQLAWPPKSVAVTFSTTHDVEKGDWSVPWKERLHQVATRCAGSFAVDVQRHAGVAMRPGPERGYEGFVRAIRDRLVSAGRLIAC
jgi:hypothetical protein